MNTLDAIRSRCSVREFNDKSISDDLIEKIVDCGRLAPTARKEEPWEFIAITDKKLLKAVAGITDHGKFIENSACAIVVLCRVTKYYLEDGCAATENMLVAASDLGVGSCWVAGDKKAYCQEIMNLLKIPAGYKVVSVIALGYPLKKTNPLEKRPLKDVLHRNSF